MVHTLSRVWAALHPGQGIRMVKLPWAGYEQCSLARVWVWHIPWHGCFIVPWPGWFPPIHNLLANHIVHFDPWVYPTQGSMHTLHTLPRVPWTPCPGFHTYPALCSMHTLPWVPSTPCSWYHPSIRFPQYALNRYANSAQAICRKTHTAADEGSRNCKVQIVVYVYSTWPDLYPLLHQYARDLLVVWCEWCSQVSASADSVHFFSQDCQFFIFFSISLSFFTLIVLFGCYFRCITGVAFRVNEPSNTELIKHFLSVCMYIRNIWMIWEW